MKIYFAGSIRGGRDDAKLYMQIIKELQNYGEVLTEHVGSEVITDKGEAEKQEEFIYRRDVEWIKEADLVVAEVTQPSLGVGYELGNAEGKGIKVICLFRPSTGRTLSAMIRGNKYFEVYDYADLEEAKAILKKAIK